MKFIYVVISTKNKPNHTKHPLPRSQTPPSSASLPPPPLPTTHHPSPSRSGISLTPNNDPGHENPMNQSFTPPPSAPPTRSQTRAVCNLTNCKPLPRRKAERVAISRSIVIFADYLSDLAVLDTLSDISASPHPTTAATIALLGAAAGVLAADLLTGIAALTVANLADGSFDVFQRSHAPRIILRTEDVLPLSGRGGVATEVRSIVEVISEKRDLFDRLVNSCFVTTPPLTVFTGWASEASGDFAVFMEAFFVVLLSLSALAPILRAGGKDCEFVSTLRRCGLLKRRDVGWCQICGVWDGVFNWGFRRGMARRRPP